MGQYTLNPENDFDLILVTFDCIVVAMEEKEQEKVDLKESFPGELSVEKNKHRQGKDSQETSVFSTPSGVGFIIISGVILGLFYYSEVASNYDGCLLLSVIVLFLNLKVKQIDQYNRTSKLTNRGLLGMIGTIVLILLSFVVLKIALPPVSTKVLFPIYLGGLVILIFRLRRLRCSK